MRSLGRITGKCKTKSMFVHTCVYNYNLFLLDMYSKKDHEGIFKEILLKLNDCKVTDK